MSSEDYNNRPGQSEGKKGPWSSEEDEILIKQMSEPKGTRQKWSEISVLIAGRSPKQCRERWEQNLKPSLEKLPILDEEGAQIVLLVERDGKKWAQIARTLGNRSDNAVKNWYNGMLQKAKSKKTWQGNDLFNQHFSPHGQQLLEWRHNSHRRGQAAPQAHSNERHAYRYSPYGTPAAAYAQPTYPADYPRHAAPAPSYESLTLPPLQIADAGSVSRAPAYGYSPQRPQHHDYQQQYAAQSYSLPIHSRSGSFAGSGTTLPPLSPGSEYMPRLSHSRAVSPSSAASSPQTPQSTEPDSHLRSYHQHFQEASQGRSKAQPPQGDKVKIHNLLN